MLYFVMCFSMIWSYCSIFTTPFSHSQSFSHNSIYSIHSSYYSFVISLYLVLGVLTIYLVMNGLINYSFSLYWFLLLFHLLWSLVFAWVNDPRVESYLSITRIEQYSMVIGIKLLLMSEFMLFFSCFWLLVNFRFVSNTSSIFIPSPLLSSYSFSIARSNALILQLSSLPIQPTQLYIKSADWIHAIESIGQGIFRSPRFINLQFSEMLYIIKTAWNVFPVAAVILL